MDRELTAAHKLVAALFAPPPAGPYASDIRVLMQVNTVGGANVGMRLTSEVQREVLFVTEKEFTGTIRQLSNGEDPEYAGHITGLFFRPGSIEAMGGPSPEFVRLTIHQICRRLRLFGHSPSIRYMSIDNRVTTGNLGSYVALERLQGNLPGFSTKYDPECFPGVICTYVDTHRVVTFLIFENGKVMGLGSNDLMKTNQIYLTLVAMIQSYLADSSLEHQRNKSLERKARKENEKKARLGRGVFAKAQAIALEVQQFLEANRAAAGTTEFALTLKSKLHEIASTVKVPEGDALLLDRHQGDDTSEEDEAKAGRTRKRRRRNAAAAAEVTSANEY
jgi:TATA-box binding protein (TBP) (component of TFIID and TFIIIB)